MLESKELEKWAKKNYDKFFAIFRRLKDSKINELKSSNHIYKRTSKEECKKTYVMDDMIYKDSTELFGLKLFLKEFSDMKSKEAIEVKLWDEYLMFAYLFGMADKVAKQFKDLYPEIVEEMEANNLDYGTFVYINNISTRTVHAASAARSAAESYSSGGGGFSSGGGGGGSFGGGVEMGNVLEHDAVEGWILDGGSGIDLTVVALAQHFVDEDGRGVIGLEEIPVVGRQREEHAEDGAACAVGAADVVLEPLALVGIAVDVWHAVSGECPAVPGVDEDEHDVGFLLERLCLNGLQGIADVG